MLTGRKLLLADDSVTIQKVVDLTFSDEGMQVTTVSDGEQAIARLAEVGPDIVLADIHMPKSSGYQVCEEIKRDQRFRHVPVILLVGSFEPFDEEEARRVGADDYLTKPFQSIRHLVNKVGSLLGGDGRAGDEERTDTQRLPSMLGLAGHEQEARGDGQQVDPVAMEVATADTAPLTAPPQTEHQSEHQAPDEMDPLSIGTAPSEDERSAETATSEDSSASPHPDDAAPWSLGAQGSSGWSDVETENLAPDAAATADAGTAHAADDRPQPFTIEQAAEPQYAEAGQGAQMSYSARTDDSLLDLGEIEPVYSAHAEDDFILDLQDEAFYRKPPAIDAGAQEPSAAATTESMDEATAIGLEEELAGAEHRAQDFTEAQLAGDRRREEFASIGAEEVYEVSEESSAPRTVGEGGALGAEALTAGPLAETGGMGQHEAQASSAAAGPASHGGQIGLDQLSPEAIDAIARRAVEHLSERVVREIAWEVVPQLAELLIKRRLEEERAPAK